MKRSAVVVWVALSLLGAGWACAQDEPPAENAEEKVRGWLRLLAVGDKPPFKQEIINGVRVEQPPPPGSLPPPKVLIPSAKGEGVEQRLQLGVTTAPVVAVSGVQPVRESSEAGVGRTWLRVRMPEHPAALAILFRDPRGGSWDQARSLVLQDDLVTHPEGAVRVVNASVFLAQVEVGGQRQELTPGKVWVRKASKPGEMSNLEVRVAIRKGEDWVRIYDSGLSQSRGERTNVVIYRADGERPRRPAKALVLKERAFLPKLPKQDGAGS